MSKLILTHHGSMELGGVGPEASWNDIELSRRGYEQAGYIGHELSHIAINAAFVGQSTAAIQTARHMLQFQDETIHPTVISRLNEVSYGKITLASVEHALRRVKAFHQETVLNRLQSPHPENVLIVTGQNPLMAYVKYAERLPLARLKELQIKYGETRVYEFEEADRRFSRPIIYLPRRQKG